MRGRPLGLASRPALLTHVAQYVLQRRTILKKNQRTVELLSQYDSMLTMPVLRGPQLSSPASWKDDIWFPAAVRTQEEPLSHAVCSERLRCCHEAAPKSLILRVSTPRYWSDDAFVEFKRNYKPPAPHFSALQWQPNGQTWDPFMSSCSNKGGYLDQGVSGLYRSMLQMPVFDGSTASSDDDYSF